MSVSANKTARILVVDDDPSMSTLVHGLIPGATTCITSALTIAEGVRLATERIFDVIVLDHLLPDGLGLDQIQHLVAHDRLRPILYITAQSSAHTAIEAIKLGAFDYLTKPINFGLLKKRLHEALEYRSLTRLPVLIERTSIENAESDVLIGRCRAMQEVYKNIGRLANLPDAVLIEGEVGTGKEMIARAIHSYGSRGQAEFLKVSSEELTDALLQAEKPSLDQCFPQCCGGTLLVEELTSLTNATQAKLLASLLRMATNSSASTRLIISTSIPSRQLIERGILRSDLYYFLSPYTVRVPALREREDDLEMLISHFMQRLAHISATNQNQGPPRVSDAALNLLRSHDWPGNVAQLKSVLQTALHESRGAVLASAALHQALDRAGSIHHAIDNEGDSVGEIGPWDLVSFVKNRLGSETNQLYDEAISELDRSLLTLVLRHTNGNQAQAAKILGMTRTSLRKKVVATSIDLSRLSDSEAVDDNSEVG
ncbi:MAG: sigma-54 dependent transcriptional regulator [Pirellulaceae bacterium]|nr:sigma-54 dependent transcriptional regulator [Pirellulaceae bacterium]